MSRVQKEPPTPHPDDPDPTAAVPGRQARATSSGGNTSPRLALPSDLSGSLQHLDDAQLDTLLNAIKVETRRRGRPIADEDRRAAQTVKVPPVKPAPRHKPRAKGRASKITPGQTNIIRAAFEAGVKPSAIARQFRIARAEVERIVGAPKRGTS